MSTTGRVYPTFDRVDKFVVGDRVEGFAGHPTGACGTVRRVLRHSSGTMYRIAWDNGGSSMASPLALVRALDERAEEGESSYYGRPFNG